MAKIIKNYELKVLKPVSEETIGMFRKIKQDRNVMEIYPFDIMKLYIGLGLIPLVDKELEDNLLKRIRNIRNTIAMETGIIIPSIRVLDDFNLKSFEFSFCIRDKQIIKYEIKRNKYLCIPCGNIKIDQLHFSKVQRESSVRQPLSSLCVRSSSIAHC